MKLKTEKVYSEINGLPSGFKFTVKESAKLSFGVTDFVPAYDELSKTGALKIDNQKYTRFENMDFCPDIFGISDLLINTTFFTLILTGSDMITLHYFYEVIKLSENSYIKINGYKVPISDITMAKINDDDSCSLALRGHYKNPDLAQLVTKIIPKDIDVKMHFEYIGGLN